MSIRESIIDAIIALYSNAKRGPGITNKGVERVYVIAGDDEVQSQEYGSVNCVMPVLIQHLAPWTISTDTTIGSKGEQMLSALISTATSGDTTLGGLCSDIRYSTGGVGDFTEATGHVAAQAEFAVLYKFDIGDPETDSNPV